MKMEASATSNLSEVHADFVRLFNTSARRHEDIRDMFVQQSEVAVPETVEIPVGDEIDTALQYTNPNNNQVPALQGLLSYLDQQYPPQPVNKYYTTHRKHTHIDKKAIHIPLCFAGQCKSVTSEC